MKALVIAEHTDSAKALAGGARTIGADDVSLVCFGGAPEGACDTAIELAVPEGALIDDAYASLIPYVQESDVVLVEPTRRCKSVAGRIAAALATSAITANVAFGEEVREMYFGGVAERVEKPRTEKAVYLVSPNLCDESAAAGANEVLAASWVAPEHSAKLVSTSPIEKSGVDLTKSDAVVAAGRGFAEEADLQLARDLADKMGAGLGCSRPLAEGAGWMPTETYIGVSGLMLSPKVYVAAGISGQMQHMVGADRAGVIFAVNKDENAPIFKQCDYGLVGDLKEILPAVTAAL